MRSNGSFPDDLKSELAMLYCEKHANESTSPAELYEMYQNAFQEIQDAVINGLRDHRTDSSQ